MPTLDVAIDARKAKQGAQQFDDSVKKVKRGAGDIDKGIKSNEKSFSSLGGSIKKVVVGMIGIAAAYKGLRFAIASVKEFAAFEMGLANVSTMLDDITMKYMPGYEKAVKKLAIEFGQSTDTLSKGLYDILSASISAEKAIDVLRVSSRAAIAGLTDTGTAADALTTIINAYGYEAKDAAKVSDILFATVKRGKITFGELAGSIGKVVALAAAAGLPFEQLSAGIATMTRAGIQSDMAMTALKAIVTAFMKPMKDAARLAKDKFGLAMNTASLQTLGLTGAMELLKDATAEEMAIMFPNVRALLGVSSARKSLKAMTGDYEGILKSTGMTERAYQKIMGTTGQKLKILEQRWTAVKVSSGKFFLQIVSFFPELISTAEAIGDLAIAQDKLNESMARSAMGRWGEMPKRERRKEKIILPSIEFLGTQPREVVENLIKDLEAIAQHVPGPIRQLLEPATESVIKLMEAEKKLLEFNKKMAELSPFLDPLVELEKLVAIKEKEIAVEEIISKLKKEYFDELKFEKTLIGLTVDERDRAIKVAIFEKEAKKLLGDESKNLVEAYEKEIESLQEMEGRTEYLDDQANAYRRLYDDMDKSRSASYDNRIKLLNEEKKAYEVFIKDRVLLDEWYAERKREIDRKRAVESQSFTAGFKSEIEGMQYDLKTLGEFGAETARTMEEGMSDYFMVIGQEGNSWKDAMEGIFLSVGKSFQRMIADMIAQQMMRSVMQPAMNWLSTGLSAVVGGFVGGIGGAPGMGTEAGATAHLWPGAKGDVLSGGSFTRFAKGDILTQPTIFPMSNGGVGLAGEAGNEAIMPLGRDAQGRLGVRTDDRGGGSGTPIKIINVMDQSAVQEYLGTGDGERMIVNIMRRNANEIQDVVG